MRDLRGLSHETINVTEKCGEVTKRVKQRALALQHVQSP
jgi:hypothetical protein